jgi:hypothetical protein
VLSQAAKDVGAGQPRPWDCTENPQRGYNREDGSVSIFFADEILKSLALAPQARRGRTIDFLAAYSASGLFEVVDNGRFSDESFN